MTDIVSIGFQVRTDQIETGFKRMDKLGKTSEQTEKRVTKSVNEMSSSFGLLKDNIGLVQTTLAALVASSGIGAAISANREFAKSVSSLSAITGAVGDDLEFYKQQAAEIGSTTTLSASQAVTAFKLIASAKPDLLASKEALAQVTREAVALSEATGGELGLTQAASALGGALNQFQLDASEASRVVNLLAESSRAGAADVVSISDSLVNVGAAANAMNVDIVEVVAGLEALAAGEIKGSEAGTGLRQVLVGLEKTGKQNLMPSVVGLTKAVENLAAMNLSTTETIKLFGQEGLAAASTITAQIGTLTSLASTIDGTNTAYNQASTQVDNLDGDLKSLNSVIESIAIGIGEDLDPALRNAAQSMTEILSNTEALGDAIEAAAVVVAIGATPAVVTYTKSLYAQISAQLLANTQAVKTVNVLGQVRYAAASATIATNALGMATRFLLGPWGLLITALGTAATAFSISKSNSDLLSKSLDEQNKSASSLLDVYSAMSNKQLGQAAIDSRMQQIELDKQIIALQEEQERIRGKSTDSIVGFNVNAYNEITQKIKELVDQKEKVNELQNAIVQAFNNKIPNAWESTSKKARQIKSDLNDFGELFGGTDTVDLFALNQANDYDKWIESISTTSTRMAELRAEIEKTQAAVADGDLSSGVAAEYIADLNAQIKALEVNPFESMTQGAQDALQAMSGMFESGSKDAKKLAIAMQALNLVQAVGAVLNQGSGDPYTAFGRMAAMAAMVASLGISIGNLSGGFEDVASKRQSSQGLNSWGEKSESILEATEATANSTKQLVGINTDMLSALENLSAALSGASNIISRNANIPSASVGVSGNVFSGLQDFFSGDVLNLTGKLLGDTFEQLLNAPLNFIGKWLGGSSSVADEGIRIIGGQLSDLIENVTVEAFQQVDYKKWKFGSKKTKTAFESLGDQVSNQFSLVFESLADTVATGAESLGFSTQAIENAINNFVIGTSTISLKDLDSDARVAEIEAYFSSVFNDLASTVIPFLDDFQKAGEELGETLSRLSTEASIGRYLIDNFNLELGSMSDVVWEGTGIWEGLKIRTANGVSQFLLVSNAISEMVGGVDEFASKVSSFTDSFASDQKKLDIYTSAMTKALEEVNLTLPDTAKGFYDLFTSLDATTEIGQQQVAAILNIVDTADAYYAMLEKLTESGLDEEMSYLDDEISSLNSTLNSLTRGYSDAAESLFDVSYAMNSVALDSAIAAARLGDFSLADALDLSSLNPSKSDFSSALEFNLARAETAAKLNELQGLQDDAVDVNEKQLSVLEEIRDALNNNDTMANSSEVVDELALLREQSYKQSELTNQLLQRLAYTS